MDKPESVLKSQKITMMGLGGLIIVLLIWTISLVATMEPDTSPEVETAAASPEVSYDIPAPQPDTVENADPQPEKNSGGHPSSLDTEFERVLREGVQAFDGSLGGYKRGVRYIQAGIINNPDFEGTEYIERAKAFLKKNEENLNRTISAEFDKLALKVEHYRAEMNWYSAFLTMKKFPQEYCSISTWSQQYNDLYKSIKNDEQIWFEEVTTKARQIAEQGDLQEAIDYLTGEKSSMSGKLSSGVSSKINDIIAGLGRQMTAETGISTNTAGKVDTSEYLREGDPSCEFWLDFEKFPGPVQRGIISSEHVRPGSAKCIKADFLPDRPYNQEEVGIIHSYSSHRTRVISFWYFLEKPTPYLTLTAWDPASRTPFFKRIAPQIGVWAFFYVSTAQLSGAWGKPPVENSPGMTFTSIQITVGKKGDPQVGLFADNIALTQGTPIYMFPQAEKPSHFLNDISLSFSTDFAIMDFDRLVNLIPLLGTEADRSKAVIAGGIHISDDFLSDCIEENSSITFLRTETAGKNASLSEIEFSLDKILSSHRPSVAVIFAGVREAVSETPLSDVKKSFSRISALCRNYGCIAVFITIPPLTDPLKRRGVENFNDRIKQVAHSFNFPVVDAYTALSRPYGIELSAYLNSDGTLNKEGYGRINTSFSKLFAILKQYILR